MAEEFQESEVIFSDDSADSGCCFDFQHTAATTTNKNKTTKTKKKKKKKKKDAASSLPVNIPADHHHHHRAIFSSRFGGDDRYHQCCGYEEEEEEEEEEEAGEEWDAGEMVPPHVIVGRRIAGKMAFSLCTGNGRTLKGRDLSRVRNSILRMTGFLES